MDLFKYKEYLAYLSGLCILVLIWPSTYNFRGILSRWLLVFIVYIRPISDIFNRNKILKKLVILRKEIGIVCGVYAIAHSLGYFINYKIHIVQGLINPMYWDFANLFGWGMIALMLMIPLLFTSNIFSMKKLGKNWKRLQSLTYLLFVFVALHISLIGENIDFVPLLIVGIWMILWVFVELRKKQNIGNTYLMMLLFIPILIAFYIVNHQTQYYNSNTIQLNNNDQTIDGNQKIINTSSYINTKKLKIKPGCIGCGRCYIVDPKHFQAKPGSRVAEVISQDDLDTNNLERAIDICPVEIIEVN